jgi:hypothetical protein
MTVGIDGGYVRDWGAKKPNFEVIVGKSTLAFRRDEEEEIPSSKRASIMASATWPTFQPKNGVTQVVRSQLGNVWCATKVTDSL